MLLEVLADAERPPAPGEDDAAHGGVVGHLLEHLEQPDLQREVDRVHGVGPVEHHRRHAAVDVQLDHVGRSLGCGRLLLR